MPAVTAAERLMPFRFAKASTFRRSPRSSVMATSFARAPGLGLPSFRLAFRHRRRIAGVSGSDWSAMNGRSNSFVARLSSLVVISQCGFERLPFLMALLASETGAFPQRSTDERE